MGEVIVPSGKAGKLIACLIGLACLGIGLYVVYMGLEGRTPVEKLKPREIPGVIAFGALFAWGGIQTIVLSVAGDRLPRWGHVILLSMFLVCLAAPFILSGILTPDQVKASVSVNSQKVIETGTGRIGQVVFVGAGILLLVALPFLVRVLLPKKQDQDPRGSKRAR